MLVIMAQRYKIVFETVLIFLFIFHLDFLRTLFIILPYWMAFLWD